VPVKLASDGTPVREALRRVSGEGLVEFHPNRGFRTADLGLDAVLRRLEVRLLVEPGIARRAGARRTPDDLRALHAAIERERRARSGPAVHDASRDFHMLLARAAGNGERERVLESLWILEVGRRLLTHRSAVANWRDADVAEHEAIASAVADGRASDAELLMEAHLRAAMRQWEPERRRAAEAGAADGAGAARAS
jgi:DNA-binding GntR family transcriptional regulator